MREVLLQEIADIKICTVGNSKKTEDRLPANWIVTSSLLPYNQIGELLLSSEYKVDEEIKAKSGDILIRRLSPTEVNYLESDMEAYIYNNIVIVRANENVSSAYLASYLDAHLEDFVKMRSSGAIVMAIGKKDLSEMTIEVPDLETQKAIGNLWLLYNEKKRLQEKLTKLERIQNKQIFKIVKDKMEVDQ